MAENPTPFYRISDPTTTRRPGILRLMRIHYALAGVMLLVTAVGLAVFLYSTEFERVDWDSSFRLTRSDKLFEFETQGRFLLMLIVAFASLVQLRAAGAVGHPRPGGLRLVRTAAAVLLIGFPLSVLLWQVEVDVPGLPVGPVHRVLQVAAIGFGLQALAALWYVVQSFMPPVRSALSLSNSATNRALRRMRLAGTLLVGGLVLGLAITLAVLTDWIELPVPRPESGELLYAMSFEDLEDEWDIYDGRDSAQVIHVDDLALPDDVRDSAVVSDDALVIVYGSPYTNEVVFSALDRKFNDMDLRVTTLVLSGPVDNEFGVVFRYRDQENYYGFFISGDGYYSLVKRQDDRLVDISTWGESEVINQGYAPNTIRIVARGDEFRFFVNGQPMPLCLRGDNLTSMWLGPSECYTDDLRYVYKDSDFKQGRVALAAGSSIDLSDNIVVAFDDLVIVGPEPNVMISEIGE